MTKSYGTTRCEKCTQDLTGKIQVFDNGHVWCEQCNYKLKDSYYE